jgi:hypothetical protein
MVSLLAGVAVFAGPVAPARAQMPNINLLADAPSKTPEEKEADEAREKAYKDTLRKIPDAKVSSDPWGGVRSADAPKSPASKTSASAKTKTKAGGNAN